MGGKGGKDYDATIPRARSTVAPQVNAASLTFLDEHLQRKHIIHRINGAMDSTVSAMPALIGVSHLRSLLVHNQKITRTDLHTGSANCTNILFDYRWHKILLLKSNSKNLVSFAYAEFFAILV
jgi:hypothetical protein